MPGYHYEVPKQATRRLSKTTRLSDANIRPSETLHYAHKESETVFVCCLDGRQAFDHVRHAGLFYKLIELNVDRTTLLAFRAINQNACCHIQYNGLRSENFSVKQGTKQEGRSSPLLYLDFIDGLIKEFESSGQGGGSVRYGRLLADICGCYDAPLTLKDRNGPRVKHLSFVCLQVEIPL